MYKYRINVLSSWTRKGTGHPAVLGTGGNRTHDHGSHGTKRQVTLPLDHLRIKKQVTLPLDHLRITRQVTLPLDYQGWYCHSVLNIQGRIHSLHLSQDFTSLLSLPIGPFVKNL
uniref:Uncharacterized protein n=1 Tax=Cacopsylla melanoneura TaxID=428564 RepID=A0A8D9EZ80_9HEMI